MFAQELLRTLALVVVDKLNFGARNFQTVPQRRSFAR